MSRALGVGGGGRTQAAARPRVGWGTGLRRPAVAFPSFHVPLGPSRPLTACGPQASRYSRLPKRRKGLHGAI